MPTYAGAGGVNREITELDVGVGGVNRACQYAYAGVGGVNRQVFSSGTPLSSYSEGDVIQLKRNDGLNGFIILQQNYPLSIGSAETGTLVINQTSCGNHIFSNEMSEPTFSDSDVAAFVDSEMKNNYDPSIYENILTAQVPCWNWQTVDYSIEKKVWLLSRTQTNGNSTSHEPEGEQIPYLDNHDIPLIIDGETVDFWLRSPGQNDPPYIWTYRDGSLSSALPNEERAVRQSFVLKSSALLRQDGTLG